MKNQLKLLIVLAVMFALAGCSLVSSFKQPQVNFLQYPGHVTAGEVYTVKGEYLTPTPGDEEVRVILTVREVGNNTQVLYSDEVSFINTSQIFEFADVIISDFETDPYFEMKLILGGKAVLTTNTNERQDSTTNWHTNIITTYFNPTESDGSPAKGTWNNDLTQENPFYFALPYRDFYYYVWDGNEKVLTRKDYYGESDVKNRWIEIYYPEGDRTVYAQWEDVGPWNYYDPYYVFSTDDSRPYAEIGIDMGWSDKGYRETNGAGLDISPTTMKYLTGEPDNTGKPSIGKINVSWRFVSASEVPNGPWKDQVSTTAADVEILNLETQTLRNLE